MVKVDSFWTGKNGGEDGALVDMMVNVGVPNAQGGELASIAVKGRRPAGATYPQVP